MDVKQQIESLVKSKPVVIYMKGTPDEPQCGFSAQTISVLEAAGVKAEDIAAVDVLADPAIRDGIKRFTNWPTIPQVFVKGEFIGGCDIVTEMYESGELQKKLGV